MPYEKIIIISLDALRADGINFNPIKFYPQEYSTTVKIEDSYLDEVASQSCFFNNAISVAPYTSASHAAYFTGCWPKNNGLYDQFNSKLKIKNIFEIAKKNNYNTVFKTDFPFILGKYLNLISGVDKYFIETETEALDIVKNKRKVMTFFHFGQIHYPYGFHSLKFAGDDYRNKILELEKKYSINPDSVDLEDMAVETFRSVEDLECLYRYKKIISFLYRNKLDNDLFDLYLEGINYFHKNKFNGFLRDLIALVEKKNYLIIIFADHGEAWNDNTYGHHNSLDEGVVRVPIIFLAKDIPAQIYSKRVRTIDLTPTIIGLCGFNSLICDGKSLKNIILNKDQEDNRDAFSAVWVNEARDVLENVKMIISNDSIVNNRPISVKYSAAYYLDDYKYIEEYLRFVDRSEKLTVYKNNNLFEITGNKILKIENDRLAKLLSSKIIELNSLSEIRTSEPPDETLRQHFKMQGYNI